MKKAHQLRDREFRRNHLRESCTWVYTYTDALQVGLCHSHGNTIYVNGCIVPVRPLCLAAGKGRVSRARTQLYTHLTWTRYLWMQSDALRHRTGQDRDCFEQIQITIYCCRLSISVFIGFIHSGRGCSYGHAPGEHVRRSVPYRNQQSSKMLILQII